ncbi:MAG: type IX secretion system outer membrane channel protein PorV [Tannerella sp.]|nr:type IX secretion system outer membrane channel protein PorV [Tannerella sp.]
MKKMMHRGFLLLMSGFVYCLTAYSQDDKINRLSPLHTAIPSLSIAPDARGGAMGDNGVATLPDINSQYWNPAKYAFMYSKAGASVSYTPWLRKLVSDMALAYVAGYYKLGNSDRSAISASLRYFSLGQVPLFELSGQKYMDLNPYEMALDASYSMKLSESSSAAVTLRYIRSDMGTNADSELQPDNGFAADISAYTEKYVYLGDAECLWSSGIHISNLGTKISFNGGATQQFLPANLKVGTGLLYPVDEYNRFGVYLDLNKFLVPTVPVQGEQESAEDFAKRNDRYNTMNAISGAFGSFSDAPGGLKEELNEVNISLGAEYNYNEQFFMRGGYYYENRMKGNRQYFSVGAGFSMNVFRLDAAYLISTVQSNPLDQTLRFSISFDMDGLKSLFE